VHANAKVHFIEAASHPIVILATSALLSGLDLTSAEQSTAPSAE
jgi:hypothetical protein